MPVPAETVVVVGIGLIAVLLLLRAVGVPGWLGRSRRPETRSIRVVGVGGGGGNAVDRMVDARINGVSFVASNTDAQALRRSRAGTQIRIGDAITGGLGSGGDPEIGRRIETPPSLDDDDLETPSFLRRKGRSAGPT